MVTVKQENRPACNVAAKGFKVPPSESKIMEKPKLVVLDLFHLRDVVILLSLDTGNNWRLNAQFMLKVFYCTFLNSVSHTKQLASWF